MLAPDAAIRTGTCDRGFSGLNDLEQWQYPRTPTAVSTEDHSGRSVLMKENLVLVALLSVLFLPAVVSGQRPPDPERAAVGQVITRLGEHLQAGNMSAAEALFRSGGLHILADNATTHGWEEYRDGYLLPELSSIEGLRYAHTAVESVVRDDVAWVAFRREVSGDGGASLEGRGTAILEKTGDRWVIVHLHVSK